MTQIRQRGNSSSLVGEETQNISGHLQLFCRKPRRNRPSFPFPWTRARTNTHAQTRQIKNDTHPPPQKISHAQSRRMGQVAIEY